MRKASRAVPSSQSESFHKEVLQEKHCLDSSKKKGSSREGEGREGDRSSCAPKAMCLNFASRCATRLSPSGMTSQPGQGLPNQSALSTCLAFLGMT